MEFDKDLQTLLSEQRRELTAAQAVDSDLHFSYQLQMQEAMTASLSKNGDIVSSPSNPTFPDGDVDVSEIIVADTFQLFADEISDYERQLLDRKAAEGEMKKIRDDLNRRIHDHAFAREILNVPDQEWKYIGDKIEKPYLEGSAVVVNNKVDSFRVHVKGIPCNEAVGKRRKREGSPNIVGGIGVAVCDMNDLLVCEVSKGVVGVELSDEVVEMKALIEGLHLATVLGLKRASIVCDSNLLYECFTGKWRPKQGNLAILLEQVALLRRNLTHCNLSLVEQKDVKFAFKLAQDAIVSHARQLVENIGGENVIETCAICLEDINLNRMFSTDGCLHRYCFSCMRRHIEVKLLQGTLPNCPHEHCKSQLKADDCKKFLTPELFDIMIQHIMESSIPPADKFYCPYPTCSVLFTRSECFRGGVSSLMRYCKKCDGRFCVNCKVAWHDNMTCFDYKKRNPNPCPEDAKLKSLATRRLWRQCSECKHMVSLGEGCNHVNCRCGHEFCYLCGAAWKNKKATCTCPLWDERRIIYDDRNRLERGR